jgi:DNA invertase Pin-like site-specific DNA recombinase
MQKSVPTPVHDPVPAAEYVRMSDDGQQFSIKNQQAAIEEYAKQHNFVVVRTYEDAGKSGLELKHRAGLRELIQDVKSGKAEYKAILVYDVSRWGRFQNTDEAAYYEFICTSAGIPLHFCAEPFANDATPFSSILKALKRSMAAEFSRDLGEKVFRGKTRLVRLGFWVGGMPGFGYRRLMISADGKPKQKMKFGEHKSLTLDRVILVHGPQREVECVRKMFQMVLNGRNGCTAIARELNRQGIKCDGRSWSNTEVRHVLTNPKYAGCNVWNRTSAKLKCKVIRNKQTDWIMKSEAFAPIVDQETFGRVQVTLPTTADQLWSDDEILARLRRLLAKKGRLSEELIKNARGMPAISTLHRHLGSYEQIYKKVGFQYDPQNIFQGQQTGRSHHLRGAIVKQLTDLFPENVEVTHLAGRHRSILRIDDRFNVSLLLCRAKRRGSGNLHWVVEPNPAEREYITLLCKMAPAHNSILDFYLFPRMNLRSHRSFDYDPWLATGIKLKNLSQFYEAAKDLFATRKIYAMAF